MARQEDTCWSCDARWAEDAQDGSPPVAAVPPGTGPGVVAAAG